MSYPTKQQLIYGHTSEATAYVVNDYPYGYTLRCKKRYWIETTKHGDRVVSQTTNPKRSGEVWNAPKKSTYYQMCFMYLNDEGHVKSAVINYAGEGGEGSKEMEACVNFLVNIYGMENLPKVKEVTMRMRYYAHFKACLVYNSCKYSPEARPAFIAWVNDTARYVAHCDFVDICKHPAAPPEDLKDASPFVTTGPISLTEMMNGKG